MGGQACVFYGAAEFSRDIDLAILLDEKTFGALERLVADLQAEVIAVPPFDRSYLARGHAVHFRSRHPESLGVRLDVMAVMRGVDPFPELWKRRTTVTAPGVGQVDLLSLPDLVAAKKTQRDKDWPMIRRLVERDYFSGDPTPLRVRFWLRELRTPSLLVAAAAAHPVEAAAGVASRPLLEAALAGDEEALTAQLEEEEALERARDRAYWAPLRAELETLRRQRRSPST
jgi:hypothetical protein